MIKLADPIFTDSELALTVKWLNDGKLMQYSEQRHKTHDVVSQLKYIKSMAAPHQYRKIISDDQYVGTVSAYIDPPNQIADVGILIGMHYRSLGLGFKAWSMFCNDLGKQGIRKIEAGCMAQNKAMLRIFEKNHMRLEGTRRNHFWIGSGTDDLILYGRLT